MPKRSKAKSGHSKQTIWHVLNRLLIALIVILFLVIAGVTFTPQIRRAAEERKELQRLKNEIHNQEVLIKRKKRELELLKTSPEYVEIIARDKMDLMKDGEVIFRIHDGGVKTP